MLFYFSATGNSKCVAQALSQATGEAAFSISQCRKESRFSFSATSHGERIGFVTPVYFWGLPSPVVDFLDKLQLSAPADAFVYHVLTFGTTTGQAHYQMSRLLLSKGLRLDGRYIVRMVDTWTPLFNLSDKTRCQRITDKALPRISHIAEMVKLLEGGDFDNRKFPHILAKLYYRTYNRQRATSHFHVDSSRCIGCGLCATLCPEQAIEVDCKLPRWRKSQCAACLSCLHHCPRFAIQYGCHTARHGQFVNPYANGALPSKAQAPVE